jgi:hypothetical protein
MVRNFGKKSSPNSRPLGYPFGLKYHKFKKLKGILKLSYGLLNEKVLR